MKKFVVKNKDGKELAVEAETFYSAAEKFVEKEDPEWVKAVRNDLEEVLVTDPKTQDRWVCRVTCVMYPQYLMIHDKKILRSEEAWP